MPPDCLLVDPFQPANQVGKRFGLEYVTGFQYIYYQDTCLHLFVEPYPDKSRVW